MQRRREASGRMAALLGGPVRMVKRDTGRPCRILAKSEYAISLLRKQGFVLPSEPVGGEPEPAPEPKPRPKPEPVEVEEPEPFAWDELELDELKAHYGRAMSEGALLANPHGNAGVKWYAEKLGESGWEPTTETP